MAIDYSILKLEILKDPLNLGYGKYTSLGDDTNVANLLNSTTGAGASTKRILLPLLTVLQFAAGRGIRARIDDMSKNTVPELLGLRSLCLGFIDMCWGVGTSHYFDLSDPNIAGEGGFLDAMVAGGIMSKQDESDLISIGTVPSSRAEFLFGSDTIITNTDVSTAIRKTD